jgi:hypothetical protein
MTDILSASASAYYYHKGEFEDRIREIFMKLDT